MFTKKAQKIIDMAKHHALSANSKQLDLPTILTVIRIDVEASILLAECVGLTVEDLRLTMPELPAAKKYSGKLALNEEVQSTLVYAKELSKEIPDRSHPGLINLCHLVCAMGMSPEACSILKVTPVSREDAMALIASWCQKEIRSVSLEELTARFRQMRRELLVRVFGQDHAVHAFIEGLFNAEVLSTADETRRAPRALFVFAGPPGVGKTFLAELGASCLDRPFKRFDMSAYSGHYQNEALVGMAKSYHGAHPGILTEFVSKNPNAVLLFDEIEKAHQNTIHLFLQILDNGTLEDKYYERTESFKDTTIIFTTNAGRKLYEHPNMSGIHRANATFHRKTILDALETEQDPATRQPFFPPAICSRLATGYPVLFNYLRINELERVVRAELSRQASLFERQYYKGLTFGDLLPMCLVLREGGRTDARAFRAQAETFVKTEIFKFCQLFKAERLEDVIEKVDRIHFALDEKTKDIDEEVRTLFEAQNKPRILLVAAKHLADLYRDSISAIDWRTASSAEDALQTLANEEVDIVLLDLWLSEQTGVGSMTIQHFDHIPMAAKGVAQGQELLRKIRVRLPELPVYLLSRVEPNGHEKQEGTVDEELFMACVRAGGARGVITSSFVDSQTKAWEQHRDRFAGSLLEICRCLYREKAAERLGRERKVLTFDTAPRIDRKERQITVRLRNLHLTRAVAAADAAEVLDEVERPQTKFEDVIGAESAKEELKFFIDYLRNPKRFAALGLKPPKGVLLYGPPGTGKTMLARAMAGESDVAFIPLAAGSLQSKWLGESEKNIRDLFNRARRYAPSIIFIDEIDSIGQPRGHSDAPWRDSILNALLTEMDGFVSPSVDRPVFVLAATNFKVTSDDQDRPERATRTLDQALLRRFSRTIPIDLPGTEARKKYLLLRLQQSQNIRISESAVDLLAEKSVGMTIAELETVIESAMRMAIRKNAEMTDDILIEALDTAREGEAKEWSPEFLEGTARHEAGHTVMYWLSGWLSPEVSIIARADYGGGMRSCEAEIKRENLTRDEMLSRIRTCLGGRAAEIVYYGNDKGLTTGAAGDLEKATNIARQMICRYGMDEDFGLLATPELFKYAQAIGSPTYQRVNEAANKILIEEMDKTVGLLEQNRKYLDAVTKALLEKNRILRCDLEQILPVSAK